MNSTLKRSGINANYFTPFWHRCFSKIKRTSLLLILVIFFNACDQQTQIASQEPSAEQLKLKSVLFKDLKAQIPEAYPNDLINFTYSDLQNISRLEALITRQTSEYRQEIPSMK
jgi:hypothetical protein